MRKIVCFATVAFATALFIAGCGGSEKGDEILPPGDVSLVSPSANSACIQASALGLSTFPVTFLWKAATDAVSYRIDITNLNTQTTSSHEIKYLSYSESLAVNAFYSWSVTAINAGGSTSSETLKFYLSGTPASNYAPFPADLVSPVAGTVINANGAATVQVNLQWAGTDLDNDIASYALYLDEVDASTLALSSLTASVASKTLASGKNYYWKIVTTDKVGNSSCSVVSWFKIQ